MVSNITLPNTAVVIFFCKDKRVKYSFLGEHTMKHKTAQLTLPSPTSAKAKANHTRLATKWRVLKRIQVQGPPLLPHTW